MASTFAGRSIITLLGPLDPWPVTGGNIAYVSVYLLRTTSIGSTPVHETTILKVSVVNICPKLKMLPGDVPVNVAKGRRPALETW